MMAEPGMRISPPITDPVAQFTWHAVNGRVWPITLIVGDNWVTAEGMDPPRYVVNADESATSEQVEAMLIDAGGIGKWHPSK
jgi:hypothetical protein